MILGKFMIAILAFIVVMWALGALARQRKQR